KEEVNVISIQRIYQALSKMKSTYSSLPCEFYSKCNRQKIYSILQPFLPVNDIPACEFSTFTEALKYSLLQSVLGFCLFDQQNIMRILFMLSNAYLASPEESLYCGNQGLLPNALHKILLNE